MNTIILQIIEKDLRDNDKDLAIEKEKTKREEIILKHKEIEERIEIQRTEQLQLRFANKSNKKRIHESQRTLDFFYSKK